MSKTNIKATIDANIKTNGNQEITGVILNSVMKAMVDDYAEDSEMLSLFRKLGASETYTAESFATWGFETFLSKFKGQKVYLRISNTKAVRYYDGNTSGDLLTTKFKLFDLTDATEPRLFIPGYNEGSAYDTTLYAYCDSVLHDILKDADDAMAESIQKNATAIGFDMFAGNLTDGYIDTAGEEVQTTPVGKVTDLYSVKEGQRIHIIAGWQNQSIIGLLWGYADKDGSSPQMLVASKTLVDETVTIPSGVNYVRAWNGSTTISPSAIVLDSLLWQVGELSETQAELQEETEDLTMRMDKVITIETVTKDYDNSSRETDAGNAFFILSKTPVEKAGTISQVFFDCQSATSKVNFIVCSLEGGYYVIKSVTLLSATQSGKNTFEVDVDVNAGDFVGLVGDKTNSAFFYGTSSDNGWYWKATYDTLAVGDRTTLSYLANYTLPIGYKLDVRKFEEKKTISYTKIVATRNSADFNSIREIIAGITDASETNQYIIFVPNGRWFECDLRGKKWVKIVGESREKAILYCDGTSTNLTPSDYAYSQYSNTALNTLDRIYKHVIFVSEDLDIENLTIEAKNCKYCIHPDSATYDELKAENCHFTATDVNAVVGIGLHSGQKLTFNSCIFEHTTHGLGFYCHNWNNQSEAAELNITNSLFKRTLYISLEELGSDNVDRINLLNNCAGVDAVKRISISVERKSDGSSYWVNPETGENETDLTKVPYCLYVNASGTTVDAISTTNRDEFKDNYYIGNVVS